jgi:hypothetical protein
MRYFLDYKAKDQSLYDYQGEEFMSSKDAFDFAQETAYSLKNTLDAHWAGWSVEVRDSHGKKYFSFQVDSCRAVAPPSSSGSSRQPDYSCAASAPGRAAEEVLICALEHQ